MDVKLKNSLTAASAMADLKRSSVDERAMLTKPKQSAMPVTKGDKRRVQKDG